MEKADGKKAKVAIITRTKDRPLLLERAIQSVESQTYSDYVHVILNDGGGNFRANFGVERDGVSLLADGVASANSELTDGYPEFTMKMLQELGWDADLTAEERAAIEKVAGGTDPEKLGAVNWKTDLSGGIQRVALSHGCHPYGNGKARALAWNLPDPVPVHREPIYTPRVDLVEKYPTYPDAKQFRLPNIGFSVQKAAVDNGVAKSFPLILTTGRLVEYEGGGEETRSNRWLAELQQEMFVEINPAAANDRGIRNGELVWVKSPTVALQLVRALVNERVDRETERGARDEGDGHLGPRHGCEHGQSNEPGAGRQGDDGGHAVDAGPLLA